MNAIEVAEQIARDATCAQGEFNARVLSIIPYLTEYADEIERLRAALRRIEQQDRLQVDPDGSWFHGVAGKIAADALEQNGDGK